MDFVKTHATTAPEDGAARGRMVRTLVVAAVVGGLVGPHHEGIEHSEEPNFPTYIQELPRTSASTTSATIYGPTAQITGCTE